jgi:hypothetical protein
MFFPIDGNGGTSLLLRKLLIVTILNGWVQSGANQSPAGATPE